ncbi:MAG: hypothetical protein MUC88_03010 [Planctomycetes bacterium]|jgi:hypothetical protein|nr:hypothetical protein [Planctomycetota bacterium]
MTIEAPVSKYKRNSFLIGIGACVVLALWFAYDGYLNRAFIAEHTTEQGLPTGTLVFNQKSPPFFVLGAILLGAYWYAIRGRKLVAAEDALIASGGRKIPYDSIEQIDKTHFETKGFFAITYKNENGRLVRRTLSDRQYDNLKPILEHLIAQIS